MGDGQAAGQSLRAAHTILERHTEAVIKIIDYGLCSFLVTQVLCKAVVVSVGLLVEFKLCYALRHDYPFVDSSCFKSTL